METSKKVIQSVVESRRHLLDEKLDPDFEMFKHSLPCMYPRCWQEKLKICTYTKTLCLQTQMCPLDSSNLSEVVNATLTISRNRTQSDIKSRRHK